ncbi:Gfo/Idh/MocA family protein [Saccharopolyspora rosea]|uniref:Gfo/Idh/MocA family protein n=1 Tax=Saccharopolyspora rosea TaxID=524884 RepID=A0ABW3G218_9PSEU|nr:Gfo/Idh/MocA family oxidoreductase [Saccharopolyspora rosea]
MSERKSPVRLAVLGLGWVGGRVWLPMLLDNPDFEVVALLDPNREALQAARALFPTVRPHADPDDLDPSEVDLAVVAVPNHLHTTIATQLLRRGISTFVEKPVCLTGAEAAELAAAERAGGATVLAGSAAWHRADVKALRAQLDGLGELRAVELSWVRSKGIPGGSWFTNRTLAGGGALFDVGWHLVNIGMRMLSWPRVSQVCGSVSADFVGRDGFGADWRSAASGDTTCGAGVEDTARACLVTEDGVLVWLHVAWASHTEVDRTRIAVEGSAGRAELECTFGFSTNRLSGSRLVVHRNGRQERIPVPAEEVGAEYRRQLGLLPTLLADPGQPGAATAEAARTVALVDRIYRSARG